MKVKLLTSLKQSVLSSATTTSLSSQAHLHINLKTDVTRSFYVWTEPRVGLRSCQSNWTGVYHTVSLQTEHRCIYLEELGVIPSHVESLNSFNSSHFMGFSFKLKYSEESSFNKYHIVVYFVLLCVCNLHWTTSGVDAHNETRQCAHTLCWCNQYNQIQNDRILSFPHFKTIYILSANQELLLWFETQVNLDNHFYYKQTHYPYI